MWLNLQSCLFKKILFVSFKRKFGFKNNHSTWQVLINSLGFIKTLHEKQHFCKNPQRKYHIFLIFCN